MNQTANWSCCILRYNRLNASATTRTQYSTLHNSRPIHVGLYTAMQHCESIKHRNIHSFMLAPIFIQTFVVVLSSKFATNVSRHVSVCLRIHCAKVKNFVLFSFGACPQACLSLGERICSFCNENQWHVLPRGACLSSTSVMAWDNKASSMTQYWWVA